MNVRETNPRRLLRLKQAAEYLSVSPGTLRHLCQQGELPIIRLGESTPWLIDLRDLDQFIDKHKESL
jgi:excisionase family DNA binding protein